MFYWIVKVTGSNSAQQIDKEIYMARKIVKFDVQQVPNDYWSQCHYISWCLCDDGTMWELQDNESAWRQLPVPGCAPDTVEGANLHPPSVPVCPSWCKDTSSGTWGCLKGKPAHILKGGDHVNRH